MYIRVHCVQKLVQYERNMIETVIPIIDRTITEEGSYQFHNRCMKFISNIEILNERQEKIKKLIKTSTIEIETILHQLKESEKHIQEWSTSKEYNKYAGHVDNAYIINATNYGKISEGFIILMFYGLMYYAANKTGREPITIKSYLNKLFWGFADLGDMLLTAFTPLRRSAVYVISLIIATVYVALQMFMFGKNICSSYDHYIMSCKYRETYYTPLQTFMDRIDKLIQLDTFSNLGTHMQKNLELVREKYANTATFGEVVLLHKHYNSEFRVLLEYMGMIDDYVACAKLIQEGFVLPKFIYRKRPNLRIVDMWHPELGKTQKKNTVDFGKKSLQILTAPNKAGKSTYMKTALLNVWLAQTIGVCCARKIRLTPFYSVFWYLNIPDTLGRESLFEAELNRCYGIYRTITDHPERFYFGIMDELFTGTNPSEGGASTIAIAKKFGESSNSLFILSTHFNRLVNKINAKHNYFNAYEKQGQYLFDYILREGISNQHIAIGLLSEIGFDKDIIDIAEKNLDWDHIDISETHFKS